jgi:hypothetical protein
MANKTLFKSLTGRLIPATDAVNEERAPAYALSPKHQLAQYAATGCLNTTFYATADTKLQPELRVSETVAIEVSQQTEGFSFAYLKELFLSSMMEWMAKAGDLSMDEIILGQAGQLRDQMPTSVKSPALSQ